ncbi:thermonuclease family protein [Mycoplasmopsis columbina]|uniref:thermonuclease family protein n=1 Tax=Mycoplasmopsis columbina TaxID=114881 RepID=UPI0004A78058|nr:thermonuclease family protein [Mycoplasmopsis columbina]VEU77182.1 Staphylococcal nuclease homologue [Mycoplasmopsis columbina]
MKWWKYLLSISFILSATSCNTFNGKSFQTSYISQIYDVYDGDTFYILIDNKIEKIRVFGIDTPEIKNDKKIKYSNLFAQKAKLATLNFIKHTPLKITFLKFDKYKRNVALIQNSLNQDLGQFLIREGLAKIQYVSNNQWNKNFFINDYQLVEYVKKLEKLQTIAKKREKGIWNPKFQEKEIFRK